MAFLTSQALSPGQKTKQQQKRLLVYKRILWLLAASLLAYAVCHYGTLLALDTHGEDNRVRVNVIEMFGVALLPLLLLVGYGARTYKWGLWSLVVLAGGMTLSGWWLA
ncbi:MAG: hypothetical protein ACTINM_08670 [Acetobacter cibinongensis]